MKIALVHDYLKEYGGAESVLEALSDIFPDAPIYTSLYCPAYFGPHRSRLEKKWQGRVHQSFFRFIPFAHKLISPLRLLSPFAFKLFNFSSFDLVITSATGAYFPNALNKKNARLFCYCHTPPRYLYGLPTARNLKKYPLFNALAQFVNHFLRYFDYRFAQNVDQFIANSSTTAARIQKFYRRDSIIINPPVDIPGKKAKEDLPQKKVMQSVFSSAQPQREKNWCEHCKKTDKSIFFLTGGRLARAKRYDIPILACKKLNLPLKIFGRDFAGYQNELLSLAGLPAEASAKAGPKTEFLGEITNQQKQQLLASATAFIFASDNEDFGIAPVEAMAAGTPVIAFRSGGVTETVIDGKTGIFFDELTPNSCAKAIQKLQKTKINPQDCLTQAQKFSHLSFTKKIKNLV